MNNSILTPRKSLNKAFLRLKPIRRDIEKFKKNFSNLLERINDSESEEFNKNLIADFLKNTYYSPDHFINTKGRNDLVIHKGKEATDSVGVIIEAKKPTNRTEMLKVDNLNTKAFHELILYFMRERINENNHDITHLIATNINEWFIFDEEIFDSYFAKNQGFVNQFQAFQNRELEGTKTEYFYQEIAAPWVEKIKDNLQFTYFDIRDYQQYLKGENKEEDKALIALFKILSPEHLLQLPFANDSNKLDTEFYTELLYIIGLTEVQQKGKKIIARNSQKDRLSGSLIENTINKLVSLSKFSPLKWGKKYEDKLFEVALELVITWLNRILFLKLLEAQLINYQNKYEKGNYNYAFLHKSKIHNYHELNELFFEILAKKKELRNEDLRRIFEYIPYLNSSLFEPTELEKTTVFIKDIAEENLPIFSTTVLKDKEGKKRTGKLNSLIYLFEFLDSYDFSSEGSETIQEDNKTLINAAVLGLIFEKINGYKDGSFFTPGYITMSMCRETLRRAVVKKFNEVKGWNCQNFEQLYNYIKVPEYGEADKIINTIKICDPAVGSGHFLVSALNEIIAIKSELNILLDENGKALRGYDIQVVNDELIITDENGTFFEYQIEGKESNRVQKTLFHEKQRIIENCLFGVDISPNSVQICRLRLWIELLKNAYYKAETNYQDLETLSNLDINIKCGNSLISRFDLNSSLKGVLSKKKFTIETYRNAVKIYQNALNKQEKQAMVNLIKEIKDNFTTEIYHTDPQFKKLLKKEGELENLLHQTELFEPTKKEQKEKEKQQKSLEKDIEILRLKIEELKSDKIYEKAFEWRFEFPEVLNNEGDFVGFDVIIGNPPYIRQEEIKELKPFLQENYTCYTGVADLFVYFYELGLKLLKNTGHFAYICSNKYFRSNYGEKLRHFLTENTTIHTLIDFGDYPVFDEAIAYPSIIVMSKNQPNQNHIKAMSWDQSTEANIKDFPEIFKNNYISIDQTLLKPEGWQLESPQILALLDKLKNSGIPLGEYVEGKFYYGIKTGFNEAFVINKETRDQLINEHPSSAEILKPLIRGRDVKRWTINFADQYLIKIESSENKKHPWSDKPKEEAEQIFANTYPAIYNRFNNYREKLIKRTDQGKYFWELRSCAYWQRFNSSLIVWGNLATKPQFSCTKKGYYLSAPANLIVSENDQYLVAILNSKICQYLISQSAATRQGGFFEFQSIHVSQIPIPKVTEKEKKAIEKLVQKCIEAKGIGVEKWEAELDEKVALLYGLTPEEMAIIQEKIK